MDRVYAKEFYQMTDIVRRIFEAREHIVVQYSGGKDSLTSLVWCQRNFPDKHIVALYVDVAEEIPGISEYVESSCKKLNVDLHRIPPAYSYEALLQRLKRWPSPFYRQCIKTLIHTPIDRYKDAHFKASQSVIITGSRAEETTAGRTKKQSAMIGRWYHYCPCHFITKKAEEVILRDAGVEVWEGYAQGFVRTACFCCSFMSGFQAFTLHRLYPELADEIRRLEGIYGPMQPELTGNPAKSFDDKVASGRRRYKGSLLTLGDAL